MAIENLTRHSSGHLGVRKDDILIIAADIILSLL